MKKLLSVVSIACIMAACNNASTDNTASPDTAAAVTPMDTAPVPAPADTSAMSAAPTTMKDGLMTLKDGKMMIAKEGKWEPMKAAVTCTNGRKVSANGEVSKGGKKRKLMEGMMIDKDGQMMDKDGKMMDNTGWE